MALVNQDRRQYDDPPLTLSPDLSRIATWRSADMRDRHYFSHVIPGMHGCYVFCVLDQDHIPYDEAAENIAYIQCCRPGSAAASFPSDEGIPDAIREMNTALMASPDHRANILESSYRRIGIGIVLSGRSVLYGTEIFTD